ncbi:dihydrolipoamide acetyltransferase family protein [Convivina praedatoris]|uniref:Dihydrolipoamide acetyltransferase component of pyruvate dehydrogenase complex n=1 Tax=Convivina praedatoris TaxID=2880963 RepID=A0ABN8H6R0_9LACO|nr:dihydrolipoamide acetyltransferase family protein [Convivina sp. LMG 32447]CAH1849949.1 Dihydrolipoyllysine-residue acetyltransferase component of pyruvate dehydrogenase complex [Convivina sp. LMG 32447]CAH1849953.1 Dihydrolipoyllysine-residue acetyltransferase component of pyruvate dehydrogenase complex [Convivina sp. LMG 32447]CAH1851286.1 Dihydrolipoyllysine-residue acetyltransferase component of pyruvate dehydrogenase complex [Convivina sp. LMG 32447]
MTEIFKMPDIGEGMAEGEISHWLVKVGDTIKADDEVAEVQNDKMVQDILSPYSGTITKLYVPDGTTVAVGDPLIEFDGDGSGSADSQSVAPVASPTPAAPAQPAPTATPAAPVATSNGASVASNGNILAMPMVRQFAKVNNIDLTQVPATGRHGHITLQDVRNFTANGSVAPATPAVEALATPVAPAAPSVPAPQAIAPTEGDRTEPMSGIRKAIAKAMTNQNLTIPSVTNFDQVEVSDLVAHRQHFKEVAKKQDIHLTYLAYAVKALAAMAKKFPEFNASLDMQKETVVYHQAVNVGVAVNAPSGLFVPVIHDADRKSILTIAQEIEDLAQAVREGTIKPNQMHGATITISNLGSARGSWFTPIINANEVAILGLGTISTEPVVNAAGAVVAGQNMKLSLTYDHRLIDGMLGQGGMNYLKQLLGDPEYMLMEV